MSSKRELRDELVMVKSDRELRRMEATALRNQRDALREEVIALSRERDRWRGAAQGVRNLLDPDYLDPFDVATLIRERDEARAMIAELVDERNAALERVAKLGDIVSDLRADLAQARLDLLDPTPEPRPFRVGDRVRVAEGATYRAPGYTQPRPSSVAGLTGCVTDVWSDGDLFVTPDGGGARGYVASEFCTLIEDAPEPDDDTPTPQPVTLTLPDGTSVTFDAVVTR